MRSAGLARKWIRRAQQLVPAAQSGAVVLAYHLVEGGTDSPVDIRRSAFLEQMRWLRDHANVVSLHEVDPDGPPDQVVLTFDDAYANFHDVAWPVLRAFGLPATLYIPIDFLDGGATPIRDTTLPPCTWEQVRAMADAGLDLGSHTRSHCDLRTVSGQALVEEIRGSRGILEARLGHPVRSFCYPRGLFTEEAGEQVLRTYEWGTVGGGRRFRSSTPRHRVPRTSLRRGDDLTVLKAIVGQRFWIEEVLADTVRQGLA